MRQKTQTKKMTWRVLGGLVAIMGFAWMGQACATLEPIHGDLQVTWLFGGKNAFCPSNATEIVVEIEGFKSRTMPCTQAMFRMEGLEKGRYAVTLKAVDQHNNITWQSPVATIIVLPGDIAKKQIEFRPVGCGDCK